MKSLNSILLLAACCMTIMMQSCSNSIYQAQENLYYLYDDKDRALSFNLKAQRESDGTVKIIVNIPKDEIGFKKIGLEDTGRKGFLRINLLLTHNYEVLHPIDTSNVLLRDISPSGDREINQMFKLGKDFPAGEYLVVVEVFDMIKQVSAKRFLTYNTALDNSAMDYTVKKLTDSSLYFKNYFTPLDSILVTYKDKSYRNFLVDHFAESSFNAAAPPFAENYVNQELRSLSPDSSFSYDMNKPLSADADGLYYFRIDQSQKYGLALLKVNKFFPDLKQASQLILPLVYLTSSEEYNDLLNAPDPKKAVDEFWINIGSSKEKARKLISTYYQGVQNANRYFTSYKEGWKTDRGMVYIIFGPPPIVYRYNGGEQWIYPETIMFPEISFEFNKVPNAFSDNHYQLKRTKLFENIWYQAVDKWRKGRIRTDQ